MKTESKPASMERRAARIFGWANDNAGYPSETGPVAASEPDGWRPRSRVWAGAALLAALTALPNGWWAQPSWAGLQSCEQPHCNTGTLGVPSAWNSPVTPIALRSTTPASGMITPAASNAAVTLGTVLDAPETNEAMAFLGQGPGMASVTPAVIDPHFRGQVKLTLSGLAAGSEVLVEKYLVGDHSEQIDGDSLLIERFTLADGVRAEVAGMLLPNLAADDSEMAGVIASTLTFRDRFMHHVTGSYVFRISSPAEDFPPAVLPFTVRPEARYGQSFSGVVRSDEDPVPHAYVLLLEWTPQGYEIAGGAVTDDQGRYQIQAAAGAYEAVPFRPGVIGRLGGDVWKPLPEGQHVSNDLDVEPASRKIQGRLVSTDGVSPGPGGIVVYAESPDGRVVGNFTQADGSFELPVGPGQWSVNALQRTTFRAGVAVSMDPQIVEVRDDDIHGLQLTARAGTGVFTGRVTVGAEPRDGVEILAFSANGETAAAYTDEDGRYVLPVPEDQWYLWLVPNQLEAGAAGMTTWQWPVEAGQVIEHDFEFSGGLTELAGRLINHRGEGMGRRMVKATDFSGTETTILTREDGSFTFRLPAGQWEISNAAVSTDPPVNLRFFETVFIGDESETLTMRYPDMSKQVTLRLVDASGQAMPNVPVSMADGVFFYTTQIQALSDESGMVSLPAFDALWSLELRDGDFSINRDIEFRGGKSSIDEEWVLQRPRSEVTLRLVDAQGQPIADQSLLVKHEPRPDTRYLLHPESDAAGTVELDLFAGAWEVFAWGFGDFSVTHRLDVGSGQGPITAELKQRLPETEIVVTAVVDADRKPVPNLDVAAVFRDGSTEYRIEGKADDAGVVKLPAFAGDWEISVAESFSSSGVSATPHIITVPAEGESGQLQLVVDRLPPKLAFPSVEDGFFSMWIEDIGVGAASELQTSSDLKEWTPVGSIDWHDGFSFQHGEPVDPGVTARFYRVVLKSN